MAVVVIIATGLVLGLLYGYVVYPVFFSPLSRIPAPHWSCSVTNLWILSARRQDIENETLQQAHVRYGPVLRVGPGTISVDGVDALRAVYIGGFEKAPWYSSFDNYGISSLFSTLGSKEHSLKKRMISNVYSKSYIQASAAAKAQCRTILFSRLLPLLEKSASTAGQQVVDVQSLFMATTMDFVSGYIFGLENGTNFLQDKMYREHWLQLYLSRHSHHFWPQEMPYLTSLCSRLGLRLYPSHVDAANAELAEWNWRLCQASQDANAGTLDPQAPENHAVVISAMHAGIDKEKHAKGENSPLYATTLSQPDLSVASEVLDHVLAGHETAGIALTYLAWHLSRSQDAQDKLREELLTLTPLMKMEQDSGQQLPDPKLLDGLPLLDAMVMETLRLHAPIPGPQPRQTPYPSCKIGEHEIPGGVRIAALAHTLHQDERVFPDPQVWDYTRWLAEATTSEHRKEMSRHFWAFGSGGRMCIGSNFAINEMKHIVAAVYTNFKSFIEDDEGIEQLGGYTARPASNRLYLRFERVDLSQK